MNLPARLLGIMALAVTLGAASCASHPEVRLKEGEDTLALKLASATSAVVAFKQEYREALRQINLISATAPEARAARLAYRTQQQPRIDRIKAEAKLLQDLAGTLLGPDSDDTAPPPDTPAIAPPTAPPPPTAVPGAAPRG